MKGISIKKRERGILIICIIMAAVFVSYIALVKPFMEASEMIDQKIEIQETKLKKNQEIIEGAKVLDDQFEDLFKILGEKSTDQTELLSVIESAAKQTDININNMQPQKATDRNFYKIIAVNLVMDGQWKNITKFLHILESEPNFCFVDEITLEKNSMMADTVRGRLTIGKLSVSR